MPFAGELTPVSSGNGSVGSPVSATSDRRSPWRATARRPTIMIQHGPPSPELVSQDCAFPAFPNFSLKDSKKDDKSKSRSEKHSKSRTGSPASSARSSKQYLGPSPLSRTASNESQRQRAKSISGDNRLRRPSMTTSGRGPSMPNSGSRKPSTEDIPPLPTPSPELTIRPMPIRQLERADTAPVFPFQHNGSQDAVNGLQRHATTDGVIHEEPEHIGKMPTPDATKESEVLFTNPFPLAQPHKDTEPGYKSKRPPPIVSNIAVPPRKVPPKMRSPTVPPSSAHGLSRSLTKLFGRRRSQSVSAARREIVRTALSDEPGTEFPTPRLPQSAFEAPRQVPTTPQSAPESASQPPSAPFLPEDSVTERKDSLNAGECTGLALAPPVVIEPEVMPIIGVEAMQFKFDWSQPAREDSPVELVSTSIARRPTELELNRASMDSASSYGSIGFDERTASSRSSAPPTDEPAVKSPESLQTEHTQMTIIEMPPPLRPRNAEHYPDSPTDPLFIDGRLSPIPSEKPKAVESQPFISEMAPPPAPVLPARKDSLATASTPSGPNKGICRGCSKHILSKEKSVTSADGRLSGRYHKECFVCTTCKSPFSTAEFYVHADRPYCAYHYHEQENSLCATCGKGIEGLYMETANVAGRGREKHHPQCLKCTTCRVQLSTDYFELSGKVYCERDAFRLASVPKTHDRSPARPSPLVREYISSGDPKLLQKGSNFPERRTTRIMTTA